MHTDRKQPDVTTKILLEKRAANKDGKYPVKLRVTYQRKQKYYVIKGDSYSEDEFEKIMDEKSRGKNKDLKIKFSAIEKRAIEIIDDVLKEFSFNAFEYEYLNHKGKNVTIQDYFEAKLEELGSTDKIQTASLYRATLSAMLKFDSQVTFQKITPQYLKKFEKWILEIGNSYATVGMYMKNLKHIVNRALDDKLIKDYPFGQQKDKYAIPKSKNTKKALTINDIGTLMNYTPENQNEVFALNYWIFSYLCNGMNMVDIAGLKFKNMHDNNIQFIRKKTKDTSNEIPIITVSMHPKTHEIIESIGNKNKDPENYIFPILQPDDSEFDKHNRVKQLIKQTNKYMKRIAKKTDINPEITTYWARHSFSTILKRSGAPIEFISEQLGHQDTKVTRSYLDSFEDEQRAQYNSFLLPNNNK